MAGTPIDLSAYKPVAGQSVAAAPIANSMTAMETWTGSAIDPASMLQKAATIGQALVWNGTIWAPGGDTRYPIAPTMIGPTGAGLSLAAASANTAYLAQVPIVAPTTISRLQFVVNSGGATGNVDVGIYYSDDEATFTRLIAKGSTATPATGTPTPSTISITPTVITPVSGRRWFLAFACSSATPTFQSTNSQVPGNFNKAASFPLPATLTGMGAGNPTMPVMAGLI